jgi:hypothetical protein
MKLRERLRTLPADVGWAYVLAAANFLGLVCLVIAGPELLFLMFLCVLAPIQLSAILVIFFRMGGEQPQYGWRTPALCLMVICLGLPFLQAHLIAVDLHVMCGIYLAGGPEAVSDWAQDLMLKKNMSKYKSSSCATTMSHLVFEHTLVANR